MRVILLKPVPALGSKGDIVTVKDGYGINFLLPQGLARMATQASIADLRNQQFTREKLVKKVNQEAAKARKVLEGKLVTIEAKANEGGTLFAAIHARDIIEAVRRQHTVELPETALKDMPVMKKIGAYELPVQMKDARFHISVNIAAHA